jgi:hypothetical protein
MFLADDPRAVGMYPARPGGPERRAMHADANEMEGEKTRMIGKVMCRFRRDVRPLMMMIKGRASFLSDEISIMGYSCV